jgi:hypothetical protein
MAKTGRQKNLFLLKYVPEVVIPSSFRLSIDYSNTPLYH